jgi:hypothetical protein
MQYYYDYYFTFTLSPEILINEHWYHLEADSLVYKA